MSSARQPEVTRRAAAWLIVVYVALYLLPLGVRPLSSPDEVRYGAISHEMIATGNWVAPHFNGVRYFEKPIMGYWLNAASIGALGERPFALRLPTALAAGLTALTIFLFTTSFAGRRSALVATAIYLTTFLAIGVGTSALFDTFLTLFLTLALTTYFMALRARSDRHRSAWLAACGAACGAAFLTKGFLALAIPVLIATPFLMLERRWRDLWSTAWLPILVAAAVVAPWAVLIHLREPDFWHYFFWVEHIQRFAGESAQHSEPFWFYFAYAPLAGFPWIWALPAAVTGLRRSFVDRSFLVYLTCWLTLPWLFFSFSSGKLVTYVLPCFPPLSILLAVGLEHYWQRGLRRWWQIATLCVALALLLTTAALVATQMGAVGSPPFESFERGKWILALLCLLTGTGAAVAAAFVGNTVARVAAFAVTGAALFLMLDLALPEQALDNLAPQALLTDGAMEAREAIIVSDGSTFGSVAWYTKRNDIYVLAPGETAYGLAYPESRMRNLQDGGLQRLLGEYAGTREIFIVVRPENDAQIAGSLPPAATRIERGGLVRWHVPKTAG
jgi:4-amino-4-deoxy-L-arabinose transferase